MKMTTEYSEGVAKALKGWLAGRKMGQETLEKPDRLLGSLGSLGSMAADDADADAAKMAHPVPLKSHSPQSHHSRRSIPPNPSCRNRLKTTNASLLHQLLLQLLLLPLRPAHLLHCKDLHRIDQATMVS